MGEEEKKAEEKKMAEETKKPEEEKKETKEEAKKPEEKKPSEEGKKEEKKAEAAAAENSKETPPPPPPQEIVLKVFMHCEGCARKVRRSLKGFEGVEDVVTDCKSSKVVVKGEKADPLKVFERVQRKSHRQVELISPIPKPPSEEEKKNEEKEKPKPEEKKEEPPVITVVLKVHMHCDACAQEIKKRIQRMKGVESAEPDLKGSQVTVKGVFDPPKLVEYVYKRTGKHAIIVKQEPAEKKEEEKGKEEKKGEEGGEKEKKAAEDKKEKKEGEEGGKAAAAAAAAEEGGGGGGGGGEEGVKVMDAKKNEFNSFYTDPQYPYYTNTVYHPVEYYSNPYQYNQPPPPPQMFSDENPNACTVM